MTGTGDKVKGHLLDRKGMAIHGLEEVGMWLEEGAEGQNETQTADRPHQVLCVCAILCAL